MGNMRVLLIVAQDLDGYQRVQGRERYPRVQGREEGWRQLREGWLWKKETRQVGRAAECILGNVTVRLHKKRCFVISNWGALWRISLKVMTMIIKKNKKVKSILTIALLLITSGVRWRHLLSNMCNSPCASTQWVGKIFTELFKAPIS